MKCVKYLTLLRMFIFKRYNIKEIYEKNVI